MAWVSGENVRRQFCVCKDALIDYDHRVHNLIAQQMNQESCMIDLNRNRCVYYFLNDPEYAHCNYFFFVDTDMVFQPQQFYGLYHTAVANDLDIVGALYFGVKQGIIQPLWFVEGGPHTHHSVQEINGKLTELGAIATGFTFIHRRVLEAMWNPNDFASWFTHDIVRGNDGQRDTLGEDISFCRRAKERGFRVWGDPSVGVVGHDKVVTIDLTWFLMQRQWLQQQHGTQGPRT